MVAVLLLHDGRQREFVRKHPVATKRVCAQSSRRRTSAPSSLSEPRDSSSTGDTEAIRLRAPDHAATCRRPGGASTIPRTPYASSPPAPRGGDDQVEPAEDHRAGHRLAVPQRAEEGAEGMITRRDLLRSVAGTAGLLGWPPGHASGSRRRRRRGSGCFTVAEPLPGPSICGGGSAPRPRASRKCSTCRTGRQGLPERSAPGEVDISMTSSRR